MNQPIKGSGGNAARSKTKRKTREELDREARDRKRQKKHRGRVAGSRAQEAGPANNSAGQRKVADPRIGSKKPVALGAQAKDVAQPRPAVPVAKPVAISPEEELALLENDARLDELLDRLDSGETLSAKDQSWVDETLDRIDILMEQLGIELGDDEDDEEPKEDMLQLLKRNSSKDDF
ncbi:Der GTPase-activating protein YihI [Brenneria tiliae]|uniref:Der GTPase-activating protein YihI n=1 Tax=Brenneria tiliae TaxID=2914984 RepID=UPI0020149725|nr:Der GTPase-activating protein YihI [Brenneria tiliae]MCL2896955.1 Der GTPase-activating protein YihI [Brenneria tiliae]MCL2901650.1 Der GTPase-activating protein YihI [Brenneria tiliae]